MKAGLIILGVLLIAFSAFCGWEETHLMEGQAEGVAVLSWVAVLFYYACGFASITIGAMLPRREKEKR